MTDWTSVADSSESIDLLVFIFNTLSPKLLKGPQADWDDYTQIVQLIYLKMKTFDIFQSLRQIILPTEVTVGT